MGLEVIKNNRKIKVILSGGAANSPVLLMLSGFGPKNHLQEFGIPVVADLPVGNNLQNHMMFHMKYNINSSISMNTQTFKAPIPKVQYALFKTAIRKTQQLMNTKVFKKFGGTLVRQDFPGICDKVKFDTDEYWERLIRYFTVTIYHPVSTCRMGAVTDPSLFVDPELRVRGILNLRVADASVMRNEPSENTNAPCIIIGEKVADLIRRKDTVFDFRKQIAKLKL